MVVVHGDRMVGLSFYDNLSNMMINREEAAYCAGLFDGEGCVTISNRAGSRKNQVQARIQLQMTDEHPVRLFHQFLGVGRVDGPYLTSKIPDRKPTWRYRAWTHEDIQYIIGVMWPWLSPRRRERAEEVLKILRDNTIVR